MDAGTVLRPLSELDPELHHPVTGECIADRLASGTFASVRPIFPGSELLREGIIQGASSNNVGEKQYR